MNTPELWPGDTLCYGVRDLFDYVVAVKTWCLETVHVEIYIGEGRSIASRPKGGVDIYPVRFDQLTRVRRPSQTSSFDFESMMHWFREPYNPATGHGVRGQNYDYLALLCFTLIVKHGKPGRMHCSELWTRAHRAAKYPVIAHDWDADKVAPAQCLQTPVLETVWKAKVNG